MNVELTRDEVVQRYRGKKGGQEAETSMTDSKLSANTVMVFSDNNQAARIAMRVGTALVRAVEPNGPGNGVIMTIKRRAFRGVAYAFRNPDVKSKRGFARNKLDDEDEAETETESESDDIGASLLDELGL